MSEVKVVRDEQGNAIVIIPDIIFWNKQDIDWDAVKEYLKKYLGEIIENKQTKEKIEIGTKFADEYTGSKYSEHIRGARAKAKANAAQGIRELVVRSLHQFLEHCRLSYLSRSRYQEYRIFPGYLSYYILQISFDITHKSPSFG